MRPSAGNTSRMTKLISLFFRASPVKSTGTPFPRWWWGVCRDTELPSWDLLALNHTYKQNHSDDEEEDGRWALHVETLKIRLLMKKAHVFFFKYFMWSTDTPPRCFRRRSAFIFFMLIAVYHCLGSRSEKEQTACFGADEESGFQGNTSAYCHPHHTLTSLRESTAIPWPSP